MPTTLYHGTGEYAEIETCEDLNTGHDGFLHFHTIGESYEGGRYPVVFECDGGFDLDALPEVNDLRVWNPLDIAITLDRQGAITREELEHIRGNAGNDIRDFNEPELQNELFGDLYEYGDPEYIPDTRSMLDDKLQMLYEDLDNDGDDDDGDDDDGSGDGDGGEENGDIRYYEDARRKLDETEQVRERLKDALKRKGIPAVKYINRYEPEFKGEYSVAVFDLDAVSEPVQVKGGGTPSEQYNQRGVPANEPTAANTAHSLDLSDIPPVSAAVPSSVVDAVDDYREQRSKQRMEELRQVVEARQREIETKSRATREPPTYTPRGGRGSMRY